MGNEKVDQKLRIRAAKQKFHIVNPTEVRNIKVSRINMMNEVKEMALPSKAPIFLLVKKCDSSKKSIFEREIEVLDLFSLKINPGDTDKVARALFNFVGEY